MRPAVAWTPAMDRTLRRMRADNASLSEIARVLSMQAMIGVDNEHVRLRAAELALTPGRAMSGDVGRVPRPVAVPVKGKIDISRAPSSLETAFSRRGGR